MKTMKSLSIALVLPLIAGFSGTALSEEKQGDAGMQQSPASIEMTDGVIRKVDKTNSKITIKHGEIRNLDMPGMTMVFQVKQPDFLDTVSRRQSEIQGRKIRQRVCGHGHPAGEIGTL